MLGIRQLIVLVNKMDLIGFDKSAYESITQEYGAFLARLGVEPVAFIPISARNGDNLVRLSDAMPWYKGRTVLQLVDALVKHTDDERKPFRLPVQDVYKFTEEGDERRIIAGTVESGSVSVGEEVVFLPSGKKSVIASIEGFNEAPRHSVSSGLAAGFTLKDELFVKRGEIMCRAGEGQPCVAERFRANVFWMGIAPLVKDKRYKLKIATAKAQVRLVEVVSCIDATELISIAGKRQVDRHDVAECVFETVKPVAFDPVGEIEGTGRFVLVDNYDIAGGGIILRAEKEGALWLGRHVTAREVSWDKSAVDVSERTARNGHRGKAIVVFGSGRQREVAKEIERSLFKAGYQCYYSSAGNLRIGLDADDGEPEEYGGNHLVHLGELSRILTDAGLIFVTALADADSDDLAMFRRLNEPYNVLIVWTGGSGDVPSGVDLILNAGEGIDQCVAKVVGMLKMEKVIPEYSI